MAIRHSKKKERGQELMEFAFVGFLFVPMLMGSFVTGMNLIRSIQAQHVARDLANMYIHGADFSTYSMQTVAQRLATGLNLQIGSSFTGNDAANTDNTGDGLVTVTQFNYVGTTSQPQCQAALPSTCTNANSFVYTQRIQFGNGNLNTVSPSFLGTPSGATINNFGIVSNYVTSSGAKIPNPAQTNLQNMWQTSTGGRTPLTDGQVSYVVEVYFQSPNLALGQYTGAGVYARYFF